MSKNNASKKQPILSKNYPSKKPPELDNKEQKAEDRLILPVGKFDPDFDDADIDLQIAIGIDVEEKSMREERMMCEAMQNSLQSLEYDSARASVSKNLSL